MEQNIENIQILETWSLLTCYGFDLKGLTPIEIVDDWLKDYSLQWIRWAMIEALYQGRYKAVSVEHLLNFWSRRGEPSFHFGSEFERLITNKLPKNYTADLTLNSKDDEILPSVPPIILPTYPCPPSLLEPILNKVPNLLPTGDLVVAIENDSINLEDQDSETQKESTNSVVALKTRSIHRFIPMLEESDILGKLRMVVRRELAESFV